MADNQSAGNNGFYATEDVSFETAGHTEENTLRITKIGNPMKSHDPSKNINAIDGYEAGNFYINKLKQAMDLTAYGYPPFPDDEESFDADAQSYIDDWAAEGGTFTDPQKAAINTFYTTLKSGGNLYVNKIHEMWLRTGTVGAAVALGMKGVQNTLWQGGVTFTANGADFDGVDDYGNIGFNPLVAATAAGTGNSIAMGLYSTENATSPMDMGVHRNDGAAFFNMCVKHSNGNGYFACYDPDAADGVATHSRIVTPVADARGMFIMSRTGSFDFRAYRNGVQIGDTSVLESDGAPPNGNMIVGGSHNVETPYTTENPEYQLGTRKRAFEFVTKMGGGLTPSEVLAFSNAVNTLLTAFSANTY